MILSAAILLAAQTATLDVIRLVIPRGRRCHALLDGKEVSLGALTRALAELRDRDILFLPDAKASYRCVDRALMIIKDADFPVRIGFVGNEAQAGEDEE